MRCSARKVFARRQSGHQVAPMTVMAFALMSMFSFGPRSYCLAPSTSRYGGTLMSRSAAIGRHDHPLTGRLDIKEMPDGRVQSLVEKALTRSQNDRVQPESVLVHQVVLVEILRQRPTAH